MVYQYDNISTMAYVVDTLAFILVNEITLEGIKSKIKNLLLYIERVTQHKTVEAGLNTYDTLDTDLDNSENKRIEKDNTALTTLAKDSSDFEKLDNEKQVGGFKPELDEPNTDISDNEDQDVNYDSDETVDAYVTTTPTISLTTNQLLTDRMGVTQPEQMSEADKIQDTSTAGNSKVLKHLSDLNYNKKREGYKDKNNEQPNDIEHKHHLDQLPNHSDVVADQNDEFDDDDDDDDDDDRGAEQKDDEVDHYDVLYRVRQGVYKCSICEKEFERSDSLDKHCWNEHRLKPDLTCKSCDIHFPNRRALRKHKSSDCPEVHGKKRRSYPCRICRREFTKKRHAISHEYLHRGEKPFVCEICGKSYRSNDVLRIHTANMHAGNEKHFCEICGKSFGYKTSLKAHLRRHTGPYSFQCGLCDKGYYEKQGLERHMNSIHMQKTQTCETCGQSFASLYSLKRHIKSHTETERVVCTICGKDVCVRYYKDHIKTHSTEKKHKCIDCGKSFRTLNYLKTHAFSHTTERPHKCTVCFKSFLTKSKLNLHQNIHTGLKPFVCGICGKSSADRSNYYKHMKIHEK